MHRCVQNYETSLGSNIRIFALGSKVSLANIQSSDTSVIKSSSEKGEI